MTQRTRSSPPSSRAPTLKATSGGKKSASFDSMPRIHQGFARADPDPANPSSDSTSRARAKSWAQAKSWEGVRSRVRVSEVARGLVMRALYLILRYAAMQHQLCSSLPLELAH